MSQIRARVVIDGRVQGVFFRSSAREKAQSLGVAGWVKNRFDGKVELLLEGEEAAVDKMIVWSRQGPPAAVVTDVSIERESHEGDLSGFRVRH